MTKAKKWIKNLAGYLIIAVSCGAALGALGFFVIAFAIYRDVREPARSHLTAGTPAELVAGLLYAWQFRPIWQAELTCAQYDPELTYVPKPGTARFRSREFDTTITMTDEGLRRQPPVSASGDNRRIVMMGDSFTMGWGVNDAETFSALLESRYHYATINTGVSSYGTARELLRLRKLGLLKDAAMLVVQYCENDDEENLEFLRDPAGFVTARRTERVWREIHASAWEEPNYRAILGATARYVWVRVRSEGVWRATKAILREKPPAFGQPAMERNRRPPAEVAATFLEVWDLFPELAGKPVIVTEMNPNAGDTGFIRELARLVRNRPNFLVRGMIFRPDEMYRFDCHPTPRGHESIAAQIDQAIKEHTAALASVAR